ncbi:MAG: tRNA (adenosine(37)-N6)-threonylcarbamoyltransferase complex transferase subunit TsaD, partial [Stenotrophobium sp.]
GLPYPGGPHLAELARQGKAGRYKFPRPMTDRPGLDFSFSGLKTAVLTALPPQASEQDKADLAHAFQEAVTETLAIKCARALAQTGFKALVVAGGVGANLRLRERLAELADQHAVSLHFPRHEFCTDNAAMIAYVGWARRAQGQTSPTSLALRARWPLTELDTIG